MCSAKVGIELLANTPPPKCAFWGAVKPWCTGTVLCLSAPRIPPKNAETMLQENPLAGQGNPLWTWEQRSFSLAKITTE